MGKSLAKQSMAIIPKIRELDELLNAQDMCETVPAAPHMDARGLLMQMIVPVNQ